MTEEVVGVEEDGWDGIGLEQQQQQRDDETWSFRISQSL